VCGPLLGTKMGASPGALWARRLFFVAKVENHKPNQATPRIGTKIQEKSMLFISTSAHGLYSLSTLDQTLAPAVFLPGGS